MYYFYTHFTRQEAEPRGAEQPAQPQAVGRGQIWGVTTATAPPASASPGAGLPRGRTHMLSSGMAISVRGLNITGRSCLRTCDADREKRTANAEACSPLNQGQRGPRSRALTQTHTSTPLHSPRAVRSHTRPHPVSDDRPSFPPFTETRKPPASRRQFTGELQVSFKVKCRVY